MNLTLIVIVVQLDVGFLSTLEHNISDWTGTLLNKVEIDATACRYFHTFQFHACKYITAMRASVIHTGFKHTVHVSCNLTSYTDSKDLSYFVIFKCGPRRSRMCKWGKKLSSLSTNAASQLNILGHDGDTLGVNGAQVGVFEETHKVSLGSFLQSHDGRRLEAKISLEVLSDLTNQPLERQFADQELSALLVTTDLTKSDSTGPVPVRLLHTTSGGCGFASCLGGKLLARSLSSSRFTCGLLSTGHRVIEYVSKFKISALYNSLNASCIRDTIGAIRV